MSERRRLPGWTIWRAIQRARVPILTMGLAYLLAVVLGAAMVHTGNDFAIRHADELVARARASEPALLALQRGDRLSASLFDFGGNLVLGSVPSTVTGLTIIFPYGLAAYRGWVGGIVSLDGNHVSRLADPWEATYYLVTLVLQLLPYTLAGGAGVALGLSYFRPRPYYQGKKWLGYSREAIRDVLRIYALVVPLFLIASLWEFLAR